MLLPECEISRSRQTFFFIFRMIFFVFFFGKYMEINFFPFPKTCKRNFVNRLKTVKVIKDLAKCVSTFEKYFKLKLLFPFPLDF